MTLRSPAAGAIPRAPAQSLLERAREMDPGAWEQIFAEHHGAIYRYLYRRLGNQQAAEDLASDVFLQAVRSIERFRFQGTAFRAWLYGIAHHVAVDHIRREVRRKGGDVLPAAGDPGSFAEQIADRDEIVDALAHLTEEQQHVIVLRFFEGLSVAEVAVATGRGEGAVKALQHRALRRMRNVLARREGEER